MGKNLPPNLGHGDGTEALKRELLNSWNRVNMQQQRQMQHEGDEKGSKEPKMILYLSIYQSTYFLEKKEVIPLSFFFGAAVFGAFSDDRFPLLEREACFFGGLDPAGRLETT